MAQRTPPTWVLVAHRAGARIFEHPGPGLALRLKRTIDHPDGRKLDQEIDSDRAGRLHESSRGGPSRADREVSAHEHVADVFAKSLGELLRVGRNEKAFDRLVLVAEPGFLGILQARIDDTTRRTVIGTVRKDLAAVRDEDVAGHLEDVLPV